MEIYVSKLLEDLIPEFIEKRTDDIIKIRHKLILCDYEGIENIAHSIKGTAGIFGFEKMSQIALLMENAALRQSEKDIIALCDEIEECIKKANIIYIDNYK